MRGKGAASKSFFLATATDLTMESNFRLPSDVKTTDAFWTIHFMATDTHHVNFAFIYINWDFAYTLSSISMEKDFFISANLSHLINRLFDSNLIINMNNRREQSIRSNRLFKFLQINNSISLHRQICNIKSLIFKLATRIKNALMLNLCGNNMLFLFTIKRGRTLHSQIVRLSGTRCENNFSRISTNQISYLFAGCLTSCFGLPAKLMGTRMRITKVLGHVWQHGVQNSIKKKHRNLI